MFQEGNKFGKTITINLRNKDIVWHMQLLVLLKKKKETTKIPTLGGLYKLKLQIYRFCFLNEPPTFLKIYDHKLLLPHKEYL